MGWTFTHRDKGWKTADWFAKEFDSVELLASAVVGDVFYAAAMRKGELEEFPGTEIFALVIMTRWAGGEMNYGWKGQDETQGPYDAQAPAKVLDLLTPTESTNALEWRARCRENLARPRPKAGSTIRFAKPLEFTSGNSYDTFTVTKGGGLVVAGTSLKVRIPRWKHDRNWELVA